MLYLQLHHGDLSHPVRVLEEYFRKGGVSILQAAFAHSYFIHPDQVRDNTPYFPERARFSRKTILGAERVTRRSGKEMDER